MNIDRLNQDLILLKYEASFRKVSWTMDSNGYPSFILIYGAFPLDQPRFNQLDVNVLVPVPLNLYDPTGDGEFFFYKYIYVDDSLRIQDANTGQYRRIYRGYTENLYQKDKVPPQGGWQWLCVMTEKCGEKENILDLLSSTKVFLNNEA